MAKIRLDTFSGFSDELKKIANVTMESTTQNSGTKLSPVSTASMSKPKLPKLIAKPQPATNFDPSQDHLRSMKATPSPQVTQ